MKRLRKTILYIAIVAFLAVLLFVACSNSSTPDPAPVTLPNVKETTTETVEETTALPEVTTPSSTVILPDNRVEVVYFHMSYRCGACICYEEQTAYVVETYFQEELASGKLVFHKCDLGDRNKAPLFTKYDAFGSQLFVNTIIGNVDNIREIKEIWSWDCERDKQGFDANVRKAIEQALMELDQVSG